MQTVLSKQKWREFITNISELQEMLKGVLQTEMKGHHTVT